MNSLVYQSDRRADDGPKDLRRRREHLSNRNTFPVLYQTNNIGRVPVCYQIRHNLVDLMSLSVRDKNIDTVVHQKRTPKMMSDSLRIDKHGGAVYVYRLHGPIVFDP